MLSIDKKTGWLWILSFLGICAFPPSVLFISEFIIIKTLLKTHHYLICVLILLLLAITFFGTAKAVINMTIYNDKPGDKNTKHKLEWTMYFPQFVLLIIAFILGIYLPFSNMINQALIGF